MPTWFEGMLCVKNTFLDFDEFREDEEDTHWETQSCPAEMEFEEDNIDPDAEFDDQEVMGFTRGSPYIGMIKMPFTDSAALSWATVASSPQLVFW